MLKKYKFHLLVLLCLIIINLAFFSLNLNDFFVSDDFDWLYLVKFSEHSLTDYFTGNYYGIQGEGGAYRPLVTVIFLLNYKIFGLNYLGFHIVNLIFHIGVCFLVYLLALLLFEKFKAKNKIAILAAVFFSLLPNHSEAVVWVAAIADPVASFFYLLAFYLYLIFRKKQSFAALLISVLSFIIALLTKEIAITLPILIVVWELYEALRKNKFKWQNIILYPFGYWLILILYFLIRYLAIGLAFGYYARQQFELNFSKIFTMLAALTTDLLFYGRLRAYLTEYFAANKLFFVLLIILLVILILYSCRKYFFKAAFLIDTYIILILPVLFLGFNYFTDEGERYNYLPSVAFCLLLSLLIWQIKKDKFLRNLIIAGLIIYFAFFLINKNYNWNIAADLTEKIIKNDFSQIVDLNKTDEKLYFAALPDNLEGAQVLRNGIKQAINLYYPDYNLNAVLLNAYLRLNRDNYQDKILYWGSYPTGGYIAETFDKKNGVTGFDRRETDDYIFELWNYDYPTYTSNTIRLILKDEQGNFIPAGEENVNILIFEQGQLKSLNK